MISRASTDLYEIYEALDNAHQYEGYVAAHCPFHEDSRPSFFVYPDRYKCLACGANGLTSQLLSKIGNVTRIPNPRIAHPNTSNPFTLWLKQSTMKRVLRMAWLSINQNPGLGNYITQDRGIYEPYRKNLGIGYIDDWYTIPIRNRDGIIVSAVARKGRDNSSQAKYVLPNNTNPHILYVPNWHRARDAKFLVVTFGILDAIILAILGYFSASTITGKRISKESFSRFRLPILLIPDEHEEREGFEQIQKLGWRGQLVKLNWPDGCKDVNDIWMKDQQLCRSMLEGALHGTN